MTRNGNIIHFLLKILAQLGPEYCGAYVCDGAIHYHPYMYFGTHQGMDEKDWAYHNGTVWPWLSGPVISAFVKHGLVDEAWTLTQSQTQHLLQGATLGGLGELLDGDSSGNPIGWDKGAVSQAWSLAEYLRVVYQDYFGARVDMLDHEIRLAPRLPRSLPDLSAVVHAGGATFQMQVTDQFRVVQITPHGLSAEEPPLRVRFSLPLTASSVASELRVNGERLPFEVHDEQEQKSVECVVALDNRESIKVELVSWTSRQ